MAHVTPDLARDNARRDVAGRGLTPAAVTHLTRDALGTIDLAALAPVKKLLKAYFSDLPWTSADAGALADLAGAGTGWWRHDLDDDIRLEFGWRDGVFRIDVSPRHLGREIFDGPVVPEATPNPRTIRFVTPPIHDGPSRWYESAVGVDDPRVTRLFTEFDEVANVLVGPAFVAVGIRRPDRWEALLDPMLEVVTTEFVVGGDRDAGGPADQGPGITSSSSSRPEPGADGARALEQAWKDLGTLQPGVPADLERIVAAASSTNGASRQVAARLLVAVGTDVAPREWSRLLEDPSRSVRRAVVDAMVDAEQAALRPLLERALTDADPWTRWKALRGLVVLGIDPSRAAVRALVDDRDFRVRLEAARATTGIDGS